MGFGLFDKKRVKELEEQLHQKTQLLLEKEKMIEEKNLEIEGLKKEVKDLKLEEKALLKRLEKETVYPLIERPSLNRTLKYLLYFLGRSKRNYLEGIKGTEADTIVFTHRDGDGICCGALIQRVYSNLPGLKIFHIGQSDRDLILTVKPKERLITSDIVLDEKLANHFLELQANGIKVTCIDHHQSSLNLPEDLSSDLKSENILIWEKLRAAASVVLKHYRLDDEISRRICLIGERCDGDLSKRTADVKKDAKILNKLKVLDNSTLNELRNELSKYGCIKNKKFERLTSVSDLLVAYSSKIVENNLLYDSKDFQVYYVRGIPLVGPKLIAFNIFQQTKKDVYLVSENKDSMFIRGVSRFRIDKILSSIAFRFNGANYHTSSLQSGGCELRSGSSVKEIVEFLKDLYEERTLTEEVYGLILDKTLV